MAGHESITSDMNYFEGVEKLLEIWFRPNPANKNSDLRKIPRFV
jgi:S-adenosylmethionine decarboxylase